jgi:competence protein ComEA
MKRFIVVLMLGLVCLTMVFSAQALASKQIGGEAVVAAINLNHATAEEIQSVPGVGPALAERIVAYRDTHGVFTSVDQLVEVRGIGDKKLAKIQSRFTLE